MKNEQLTKIEHKNQLPDAYKIIEDMNKDGYTVQEILSKLDGFKNRNFKPFNAENIKSFLKSRKHKYKAGRRVNTAQKFTWDKPKLDDWRVKMAGVRYENI